MDKVHSLLGFAVHLKHVKTDKDGRHTVQYHVITPPIANTGKQVEFAGNGLSLPARFDPVGFWAAVELLCFITLRIGDTDREFFLGYSIDQLAWANSPECEQAQAELSNMLEEAGVQ